MNKALSVMAGLLLAGCVTTGVGSILPQQRVDDSFDKRTLRWSGDFGGARSIYYIKTFEESGKLAVCAARIMEDTAIFEDLSNSWFDQAYVMIGSNDNPVVSAQFVAAVKQPLSGGDIMARCVRTDAPASVSNLARRVFVSGGEVRNTY